MKTCVWGKNCGASCAPYQNYGIADPGDDELDAACLEHDICLCKARSVDARRACDQGLYRAASNLADELDECGGWNKVNPFCWNDEIVCTAASIAKAMSAVGSGDTINYECVLHQEDGGDDDEYDPDDDEYVDEYEYDDEYEYEKEYEYEEETETLASAANGKKICSSALNALSGSDFSTLAAALTEAVGPLDAFDGLPEKSIIVAPTNEAFDAALTGLGLTPAELLADKALLTTVLYDHIGAVADDGSITDLNGHAMMVMVDGKEVPLKDAAAAEAVTIADANGIGPVSATTPISCFGGDQLVFPSEAVILTKADETEADETKADETKADETKADETKADETEADETKADETEADETKADETEAKTPGGETAMENIEEGMAQASGATSLAAGAVAAVMGLVATMF